MISINASYTNLVNQRTLATNTKNLQKATERLSTGARINHANDDAAGLFVGSALASSISSRKIALDNTMLASNFLNIADGALSNVSQNLMRMNELAIQACNGFMSNDARNALQNEVNALAQQSRQTIKTATMNGVGTLEIGNSVSAYTNMPTVKENGFIGDIDQKSESELIAAGYVECTETNLTNTSNTKIYINSASQLQALATYTNSGTGITEGRTFTLSADIDLSSVCSAASGVSWEAIGQGTSTKYFKGIFDGNGHVVSNLYINKDSATYQGLFGYTSSATIKNLGIEDASIKGKSYVGILVGSAPSSTVINCFSTGSVNGSAVVGGLCGGSYITKDSYSSANIVGSSYDVGGLVGRNTSLIDNCIATGSVSGTYYTGGIVGRGISVTNSYSTGNITTTTATDGLVGIAPITNSYATGLVNYEEAKDASLKSSFDSSALDSKWDTTGENPILKHNGGSFIDAIDQKNEEQLISAGYVACTAANLENTSNTKIYINSVEQLQTLATYTNSGTGTTEDRTFTLSADIDLSSVCSAASGVSWKAIGKYVSESDTSKAFKGTFDGNGHVVSNLYINKNAMYQGLFGYAAGSTIKNVGIENANVTGNADTGLLAGSTSTMLNCYSTGVVKGTAYNTGGLGGYITSSVTNCYSTANVTGTSYVTGGLAGNAGTTTNCYATGNVTGADRTGGLTGTAGTIKNCYATGNVNGTSSTGGLTGWSNPITNCYSTGNVTSTTQSNGLVGKAEAVNSYATGLVNGENPADAPKEPTMTSFQISDGYDENSSIEYDCSIGVAFGGLDLSTVDSAQATLARIQELQNIVTQKQSYIGTQLNRLTNIATASQMTIENYSAAKSTIFDTDIAQETANMVKSQILQQISVSVLSQSKNITGQIALSLIG